MLICPQIIQVINFRSVIPEWNTLWGTHKATRKHVHLQWQSMARFIILKFMGRYSFSNCIISHYVFTVEPDVAISFFLFFFVWLDLMMLLLVLAVFTSAISVAISFFYGCVCYSFMIVFCCSFSYIFVISSP